MGRLLCSVCIVFTSALHETPAIQLVRDELVSVQYSASFWGTKPKGVLLVTSRETHGYMSYIFIYIIHFQHVSAGGLGGRSRAPGLICSAWSLENAALADVSDFEPAGPRWSARLEWSSPLGLARESKLAA